MSTVPKDVSTTSRDLSDVAVNDRFWLKWAATSAEYAITSRNSAAEKLTAGLAWFWTVYTAVAVIGTLAATNLPLWSKLLVFVPIPLLMVAYNAALWAQMPIDQRYDPRVPGEIQAAYVKAVDEKRRKLGSARQWSLGASFAIVLAGLVAAFVQQASTPSISARYVEDGPDGKAILIAGQFEAGQDVILRVVPEENQANEQAITLRRSAPKDGTLNASIPVGASATNYRVIAEWATEEQETTVSKLVKVD